jgi:hypothetical protein
MLVYEDLTRTILKILSPWGGNVKAWGREIKSGAKRNTKVIVRSLKIIKTNSHTMRKNKKND